MKQNILVLFFTSIFVVGCATTKPQVNIEMIMDEAQTAYEKKNWKVAEEKFAHLVSLLPGEAEFWFKLGNIYARTNQPNKAITAYKEVVIRKPKLAKAWHNLSVMSLRQTTHLFIEMLQYLNPNDPLFKRAKQTADDLLAILKSRKNKQAIKFGDFPTTIPEIKSTNSDKKPITKQ